MNVTSYQSIEGLQFGDDPLKAELLFGKCLFEKQTRSGELEMHYKQMILRFSTGDGKFRECTIHYGVPVRLNGLPLDWSAEGLKALCQHDGSPMEYYGSIVLFNLGLSLTGIEDGAESDRTLTLFNKGDWDELKPEMRAFIM